MAGSKQGETKAVTDDAVSQNVADRLEGALGGVRPAPVHLWNPAACGHIDIAIDRHGVWRHEGDVIGRPALVRLFAGILRREPDGSHVLVTPAEKLAITVEDAPFLAVDMVAEEGDSPVLHFLTNLGEAVRLDADHPLRILSGGGGDEPFVPYLTVRPGLEARLTRSVAADLAGRAIQRDGRIGVVSAGQFFVIGDDGP